MADVASVDSIPRMMEDFPSPPSDSGDHVTSKILSMYATRPLPDVPAIPPRSARRESQRRRTGHTMSMSADYAHHSAYRSEYYQSDYSAYKSDYSEYDKSDYYKSDYSAYKSDHYKSDMSAYKNEYYKSDYSAYKSENYKSMTPPQRAMSFAPSLPGHTRSPSQASATFSTKSSTRRHSRRSSQKIQQLTGHDVDVMDEYKSPFVPLPSDASIETGSVYTLNSAASSESDLLGTSPEDGLLPLLEEDEEGGPSTRESSWGPPAGPSPSVPAPLNISRQPTIIKRNSAREFSFDDAFSLDTNFLRPWEPGYGQFTDRKTAGQYHKIAVELAGAPGTATIHRPPIPRPTTNARRTSIIHNAPLPPPAAQHRAIPARYRFSGTAAFSRLCDTLWSNEEDTGITQIGINHSDPPAAQEKSNETEDNADDDVPRDESRDTLDFFSRPLAFRSMKRSESTAAPKATPAPKLAPTSSIKKPVPPRPARTSLEDLKLEPRPSKGVTFEITEPPKVARPVTPVTRPELLSAFDSDSESEFERPISSGLGLRQWWARRSDWDVSGTATASGATGPSNENSNSNLRDVRSTTPSNDGSRMSGHRRGESTERLSMFARKTDHVRELFMRGRTSPTAAVKAEKRRSEMRKSIKFMPGPTLV